MLPVFKDSVRVQVAFQPANVLNMFMFEMVPVRYLSSWLKGTLMGGSHLYWGYSIF